MSKVTVLAAWAPDDARWSAWVKPVLFAHLGHEGGEEELLRLPEWPARALAEPLRELAASDTGSPHPFRDSWRARHAAIVVDLPGVEGLDIGLALAREGFRPVPLYNAVPGKAAVVDLQPLLNRLVAGAPLLREVPIDAPPAFLLDANRDGAGRVPKPGDWDNRSVSLPTDFPSAAVLLEAGIRRVVLVQQSAVAPRTDVAETLHAWQAAGIDLYLARADNTAAPLAPLARVRPSLLRRALHTITRAFLRRRGDGLYGGQVQMPSGG